MDTVVAQPEGATAATWALVVRAQQGDGHAFGELYELCHPKLFTFIHSRVHQRQTAEDLTADVFVRALKRIPSVQWQGVDIMAWLVTIARNLIADHFKSGRYRTEVTTAEIFQLDEIEPDNRPDLATITYLDNTVIGAAVLKLVPEQRRCIELRFYQGRSVAETAEAMGKNDGAVKALQYRATRALGRELAGAGLR